MRTRKNLTKRKQTGTMEFDRAHPNRMPMTAEKIDQAHLLTRASKKFKRFFRSESFRDEQNLISLKIAAV